MDINKKYNIIYADPPWQFSSPKFQDGGRGFGNRVEDRYPTLSHTELSALPLESISKKDCILFMWAIDSHLEKALEVMKNWGFRYSTIGFVWVKKTNKNNYCYNYGTYTLKSTEICLIGIKGKLKNIKKSNNVKSLVFAERTIHSKKPEDVRKRIEDLCLDLPRIELFAREKKDGWDSWGNEIKEETQRKIYGL